MAPFVQQDQPLFEGNHIAQRTLMERSSVNAWMPIAIIGMSCKCPGDATSPERLWQLCAEGRSAWSDIPQNRFNAKAFYHPKGEKPGASNVLGGHFLEEDVSLFDAPFFNFSSEVANSMDPQFRLQLESTFEVLENAGLTLKDVAGTKTSVFGGSFFHDYYDGMMRDPDVLPRYCLTGNGSAMLSNRVSHFFDLRGPSVTVDTGCSTGLTALHLACQSLRTGDSTMSIVGGANVLLNPDNFIAMSCLGFLAPGGKSYSFDSRGEGYGRGEGVATIIIKPLSDALRDGNNVRAVIMASALNQDGKTPTITSPSQAAQEELIRTCYRDVGLNPRDTCYVEAHGTGTKAGDPVESRAIGSVFGKGRSTRNPLYVSSIKTNIGHLEAASGIAAVIKVALALEKGLIPPSINFETPNADIDMAHLKITVPRRLEPWPAGQIRRASLNNFGYGGTNAHIIMDGFTPPWSLPILENGHATNGIHRVVEGDFRVFMLSAKDENAVKAMIINLKEYLSSQVPPDSAALAKNLAYTLGQHRSSFPWVAATSAQSLPELIENLDARKFIPTYSAKVPRVGFVFNGQGAQWYAMGRELISVYPVFRASLKEADQCIKHFGAQWSLTDELMRDAKTTRVNEPMMSLTLCTAIQLCLVRLLVHWGIKPTAVTGHSSGEAAAAYAAGALDFQEALATSYFRGVLTARFQEKLQLRGAMLAVGLGREDVEPYLSNLSYGKAVLACVNSPSSVTISGDMEAIEELETILLLRNIFARKLKVGAAYHSHHMEHQRSDYTAALQQYLKQQGSFNGILYSSPVTGELIQSAKQLGPENWVKNMVQPVLFAQSLRNMCAGVEKEGPKKFIDMIIEIGPHSALSGPIRQTLSLPDLKKLGISYGSCLERGNNAVQTMQKLVCSLLSKGYPVDLSKVNFPQNDKGLRVICDLPSYPWNHSVSYWTESRLNKEHRHRLHATHDLLGSLALGTNPMAPTWRHIIRPSEIPWVRDHIVQSDIVFPAAGCITMAIEAMHQLHPSDESTSGYLLKDITIMKALIIPDTPEGIEVQLSLRLVSEDLSDPQSQHEFQVDSIDHSGNWTKHCKGSISVQMKQSNKDPSAWSKKVLQTFETKDRSKPDNFTKEASPDQVGKIFKSVGIEYGHLFRNLEAVRYGPSQAVTTLSIANVISTMPSQYQQDHILHPTTLDSIFQASYSSLLGSGSKLDRAMIPTSIKSLFVAQDICKDVGHRYQAFADLQSYNSRGFEASIVTVDESKLSSNPVLTVAGFFCQSIGESLGNEESSEDSRVCTTMHWDRSLSLMRKAALREMLVARADPSEIATIGDLKRAAFYFIHDALTSLTEADVQNLDWHHKNMHAWMKVECEKAACNKLDPRSSKWIKASEGVKEMLFDKVSTKSVNGQMLCRIGKNLVRILRKETAPLELMLEGKLLYDYYEKALRLPRSYEQISKVIKLFAHENPCAKILEIGGGTGGCTQPVLNAFSDDSSSGKNPKFAHYDFTDISAGFFETAREKFSFWGDMISYKKLDIEADPVEQSFEAASYDLIIACQVLHATKAMKKTMTHVRKLLRPGGRLLMIETTQDALDVFLVFATLPGWWLSEEEERKSSPSLSIDMWDRVLQSTGFSGLDVEVHDCEDEDKYSHSLIISTAKEEDPLVLQHGLTVVHADAPPPEAWMEDLQRSLETITNSAVSVENLNRADASGRFCVFIDSTVQSVLLQENSATFQATQRLLTGAKGTLWVSFGGAMDCVRPESGVIAGLLRTLRFEDRTKRFVSLDLEPTHNPFSGVATHAILDIFAKSFDGREKQGLMDFEYVQRDSSINIPRFVDSRSDNDLISATAAKIVPEPQTFYTPGREIQMDIKTPGLLDSLVFRETPSTFVDLPEDFVEVEPRAFGLNFRDVMVAMGQLESSTMGFECSGMITRVGPTTSHGLKVGDRVCALTRGNWATYNRLHWTNVSRIPDEMSFEVAASIPVIYVTAYYSLYEMARLERDETILIHAAAGGVGQAAIALAQLSGAEIFATVGSEEKRNFLVETYGLRPDHIFFSRDASFAKSVMAATNGKGVDVILNSLSGHLLQETWKCIATFGRFVEIGKRDIQLNASLKMAPFTRATSFFAVDLIHLGSEKGRLVNKILVDLMRLMDERKIRPVNPIKVYPISEIGRAFRVMQAGKHLGKIVIKASSDDIVNVLPEHAPIKFCSDCSYLLIGGLGGIGRSLAQFFVDHGAKNLILLSRSAESQRTKFPDFVANLERAGCRVALHDCDITHIQTLTRVIKQCRQNMPPIRGVIQGAMVLQDCVFDRMTFENWQAAVRPKVQGTLNLHHSLLDQPLDFFVMLSSLIGISGHTSQANYAAGATFQDAFARYRTAQGLPAISIDLGWVKSVGYVAETKGVAERMARMGYSQLEEAKVLRILESAISNPKRTQSASQIVTGIGPLEATTQHDIPWRLEARFAALNAQSGTSSDESSTRSKLQGKDGEGSKTLKDSLKNAFTWAEVIDLVVSAITRKLSDMFMIPEAEIDSSLPTSEYGVDSLVAVELRNWLFAKAAAEMSIFDMLQSKSLIALAEKVATKSAYVGEAGLVPAK